MQKTKSSKKSGILANSLIRVALMLVMSVLIWLFAVYVVGGTLFGDSEPGYNFDRHVVQAIIVGALAVPAVLLSWRFIDRKPWKDLGLVRDGVKQFLIGAAIWLIPAAIGIGFSLITGWVSIDLTQSIGDVLAFIPILILLVFIYEAFPEELIFRGYIFANLSERFKAASVVIIQAALFTAFGAVIGAAAGLEQLAIFFVFAWIIGTIRRESGNVWSAIGYHVAFQTTVQLLISGHGFFDIENMQVLQLVALGIIPFSLAELTTRLLYRRKAKPQKQ